MSKKKPSGENGDSRINIGETVRETNRVVAKNGWKWSDNKKTPTDDLGQFWHGDPRHGPR